MSLLHCPELELRHSPSSWEPFIPRQASPELDTSIDLLELRARDVKSLSDPGATYKRALNHQGLVEHLNGIQVQHVALCLDCLAVDLTGRLCRTTRSDKIPCSVSCEFRIAHAHLLVAVYPSLIPIG